MTLPQAPSATRPATHLRTRIGGYAVDMVIFAAIAMVTTVLAGFILLFSINWGTDDPSDGELYTFLGIIALGLPFVWTTLNVGLLATRGQTGGQYVAGLRLVREDTSPLTPRDAVLWWFCMNPVLLSWPMAIMVGFPIAFFLLTVLVRVMIFVWALLILLCVVSPLIALISAMLDGQNRTLYDRIIGVVAVPAE